MRTKVREYLMKNTPKTLTPIEDGIAGELSKVTEEYHELVDAMAQENRALSFVEGCDLVDATLKLQFNKFKVPSVVVLLCIYLRRVYKPFRNLVYIWAGLNKNDFNGSLSDRP